MLGHNRLAEPPLPRSAQSWVSRNASLGTCSAADTVSSEGPTDAPRDPKATRSAMDGDWDGDEGGREREEEEEESDDEHRLKRFAASSWTVVFPRFLAGAARVPFPATPVVGRQRGFMLAQAVCRGEIPGILMIDDSEPDLPEIEAETDVQRMSRVEDIGFYCDREARGDQGTGTISGPSSVDHLVGMAESIAYRLMQEQ